MARAETLECRPCPGILRQRLPEVGGHLDRRFGRPDAAGRLHTLLVQPRRLLQPRVEGLLRGKVVEALDPAELSHRLVARIRDDERILPEHERAVALERGHAADRAPVVEVGCAPFEGLRGPGNRRVHDLPQPLQDRLGEIPRFRDVRVDARVACSHDSSALLAVSVRRRHAFFSMMEGLDRCNVKWIARPVEPASGWA